MRRRRGKPNWALAPAPAPAMKGSQRPSKLGHGATDGIVRRQSTPKQPEILPLTAATGFKRLGFALLAVLAVGTGALVAASYLISADAVRQQVLGEIRAVTGLNPIMRGRTTVSLFPSGSVSFADVMLGDAKRPALTAERLTARLRFFPLLLGRVEIADVALERPTIAVDLEPNGRSNWSGLIEALTRVRGMWLSGFLMNSSRIRPSGTSCRAIRFHRSSI